MVIVQILFWLSALGLVYVYMGYPFLVSGVARFAARPIRKQPYTARVTVLISVFNEAGHLANKVRNILSLDGADMIVSVLIGSDGSTDNPADALKDINDPRVRLCEFPERRGKPSVLNDLIPQAEGEIVVMMDVRQEILPGALRELLANFADPDVAAVSGEMHYQWQAKESQVEGTLDAYWRYDKWIRKSESRIHSLPGASGALYAIRREFLAPMPPDLVLDDVFLPMRAVLKGYRSVFEPAAIMHDYPVNDARRESVRKRRTLAGALQLLFRYPSWCLPGVNPIWWQYVSHKMGRLFSPFFLIIVFVSSCVLAEHAFYRLAFWLQVVGYAVIALSWAGARVGIRVPGGARLALLMEMQWTILRAWSDAIRGKVSAAWDVSGTRNLKK